MDERATLAHTLSGRYEIEREIGRGGMATVYLARDVKHDRRVAIKVLKTELVSVIGVQRFLSEIRVTANLQHPNVLPLFDSGEADGLPYYVMPFVDGESLRDRLDREKQLPVADAVRIAAAIANAAEHAHTHKVVHRDLKPENILLQSGEPIVADFGIALAVSNAAGERMTQTGLSVGTPRYMSPEQATGDRIIDARSDVYAIGAMTYEMLVGEPPHTGATAQAIIARLLTDRPRPVRESRPSVPEHVEAAIIRALEKLPADRFSTAKEFGDAVQGRGGITVSPSNASNVKRPTARAMAAVGISSLLALAAGIGWWRAAHPQPPKPNRFTIEPPPGLAIDGAPGTRLAISRDGQLLAFIAGKDRLFLRPLDQVDPIPLIKAGPARELRFSPDGKWLAWLNQGPNKVPISPGNADPEPTKIFRLNKIAQIAWTYSSDLVYLVDNTFWRVSAAGGAPRAIASMDTTLDRLWTRPTMLPDGKTIAFSVGTRGDSAAPGSGSQRLALLSIDGGTRRLLDLPSTGVVGQVDETLLFMRGSRLAAVKFSLSRGKVLGEPVDVIDHVAMGNNGAALSDNGTLAYLINASSSKTEMVDERGVVAWALPESRRYRAPVWSPDGKRLAMAIVENGQSDIWTYDVESRVLIRLTQVGASAPAWTPDGKRIAFIVGSPGKPFWVAADGSRAPEPIPGAPVLSRVTDVSFSPDGKYAIARREIAPGEVVGRAHAFAIPLAGGPTVPMLQGADTPSIPLVSPNGKWVAYASRETGRQEVYVRAFLGDGAIQISTDGGNAPQWSSDGRTLFYRHEYEFRAVTLDVSGVMPRAVRSENVLLDKALDARSIESINVHPDRKHFVVTRESGQGFRLVVVTNWMTEVRDKLAGK